MKTKTISASRLSFSLLARALGFALCAASLALNPIPTAAQFKGDLPSLGGAERDELSPAMEYRLGVEIMHKIRADRDYIDDAVVLEYLNAFGNRLVSLYPEAGSETGYDYFFFAVRDPMLNAFALPGGFIGMHSALVIAAQTESELASVISHEIGHVSQRHIARMLGQQRQDMLLPLASMLLGALAARGSPDVGVALMTSGHGLAIQRQLNFSRDAEREADRIGFQIMNSGGYDTTGMTAFFARMQNVNRGYSDNTPSYLRTHPLTTERIADIEARVREQSYRQHADSLDFHLIRARLRVLQDPTSQGLHESAGIFQEQAKSGNRMHSAAAHYGLALIALKKGGVDQAQSNLQQAQKLAQPLLRGKRNAVLTSLSIDCSIAVGKTAQAVKEAAAAVSQFPSLRNLTYQYVEALYEDARYADAEQYLRDQIQIYRHDPKLQRQLGKNYSAQGKQALMHIALAEAYGLDGALSSALEQLRLARSSPDVTFYDHAIIDAREREWQAKRVAEMKEKKKLP